MEMIPGLTVYCKANGKKSYIHLVDRLTNHLPEGYNLLNQTAALGFGL